MKLVITLDLDKIADLKSFDLSKVQGIIERIARRIGEHASYGSPPTEKKDISFIDTGVIGNFKVRS